MVVSEKQVSLYALGAQNSTWCGKCVTHTGFVARLRPHEDVCSGEFGLSCVHALCVLYVHSSVCAGYPCDLP